MSKKIVFFWFLALAIEIAIGFFIYNRFVQFKQKNFEEVALAKIAVIDETKVKKNVDPELKYYWNIAQMIRFPINLIG